MVSGQWALVELLELEMCVCAIGWLLKKSTYQEDCPRGPYCEAHVARRPLL